ncbi:MAG: putative metal-dependent hydrolase [Planctomycetota bacterium]
MNTYSSAIPEVSLSPITWNLRVSPRAKYARLLIKPYGGLEVVIPPRFPRRSIPALVEKHALWIRVQLQKQQQLCDAIALPEQVLLPFDESVTRVISSKERGFHNSGAINIDADNYDASVRVLRQWLRKKAWSLFPPMLEKIARQTGLDYNKVSIRSQKTRWGSCTTSGNISLNDQLLFMPVEVVSYLMIHELCHTRVLSHSCKYWSLVESHCHDYRDHERSLDQARLVIPGWYLRDLYR